MSLSWPWALLALLAIPVVVGAWWWTRHRRRRGAVRVTSIALVRASLHGRGRWRRLIPVALLLLGLAVLGVGAARPQATVQVPSSSGTVMLALDVSGSMCSTDVRPNRITAAEHAASAFIRSEAGGPRIGLVPFAGNAGVLVPPTADSGALLHVLGGLSIAQGTAIGQGILASLDAIAQVDSSVAPTGARPLSARGYAQDVIVVLTDGSNNEGVDPQIAARQAAARGVRVFTIGFGTTNPASPVCSNSQFGGFGGSGYGVRSGGRNSLVADYGALRQIASITGGKFYRAQNAEQLKVALGNLSGTFTIIHEHLDIAAWFAGFGGLLIAAALAVSLCWNRTRQPSGRPTGQEASPGR
jgi:Ca-activated chloride channel family protein